MPSWGRWCGRLLSDILFGHDFWETVWRRLPPLNPLTHNIIHNPVLKTSLVFAGFFCYNCRREKKGGAVIYMRIPSLMELHY